MLKPKDFYEALVGKGIDFFAGVPDSSLKHFCAYVIDKTSKENHVVAANEGNAIALVSGYHLATGKIGLVYMQNSGQGNAVNPLVSLADSEVYGIPMLLIIGWRGEPGKHDEPQHMKQGKITSTLLETLGIPYEILPEDDGAVEGSLDKAISYMQEKKAPYALIVKKGSFEQYDLKKEQKETEFSYRLLREEALQIVVDQLKEDDIVVSTTGKTSRELFEYRKELEQEGKDFLTVGSMGHSSSIALGIALQKKDKNVYCFDGDGALIMHMGSLAVIGSQATNNFKHIVFNNGAHDSVGGQPTVGFDIDIPTIAKGCGYKEVFKAETKEEVKDKMILLKGCDGPALLEIRIGKGAREDLGRPTMTPSENKKTFMSFLNQF